MLSHWPTSNCVSEWNMNFPCSPSAAAALFIFQWPIIPLMHAKWDTDFMKWLGRYLFWNYEGHIFKWEFICKITHRITLWFGIIMKGVSVRARVWGSALFKRFSSPRNSSSDIFYSPSCSPKPAWVYFFCVTQK